MNTSNEQTVKVKIPLEWIYRGVTVILLSLIALGGKAKIKEIVGEEISPVVAKQEKQNEKMLQSLEVLKDKVDKMNVQVEVIVASQKRKDGVFTFPIQVVTNDLVWRNFGSTNITQGTR